MSSFEQLNTNLFDTTTDSDDSSVSPLVALATYCEINDTASQDSINYICTLLVENPQRPLFTFSQYGYLIRAFSDLVEKNISLQEFMSLGDMTSDQIIKHDPIIHEAFGYLSMSLTDHPKQFINSVVVLDTVANLSGNSEERDAIVKKINTLGGQVVVI